MKKLFILAVSIASAMIYIGCSGGSESGGGGTLPTPPLNYQLGAVYDSVSGTADFRFWSPSSKSVSLVLYGTHAGTIAMEKDLSGGGDDLDDENWNGVWMLNDVPVSDGETYQYKIGSILVLDPYASSMTTCDNNKTGVAAVINFDANTPVGGWSPSYTLPDNYTDKNDTIIYEIHVRDMTILANGLNNPKGSYLAFTEKLDFVKDLGATHVQLLPVLAYLYGNESARNTVETGRDTSNNNYNWGFDPQNYFSPEGMYATDPDDPRVRVQELRTLINEAHEKGVGVILDVVYNHTADTTILGSTVPGYFYRSTSRSGCGNDTASEKKMMRKLIIDSVVHWTKNYKVDGFRFDLMGIIDNKTMEDAYTAAKAENANILFLGEGWELYSGPAQDYLGNPIQGATQSYMDSTDNMAVFSDSYRDIMKGGGMSEDSDSNRGFLTGLSMTSSAYTSLIRNIRGDATNFTSTIPGDCVQYLAAHDGLTLHDKISKIRGYPRGDTRVFEVMKLGFMIQMTSQGLIFINGGDEFGRSKYLSSDLQDCTPGGGAFYCYNSYDADDDINGYDWSTATNGAGHASGVTLYNYVAGLIAIRNSSSAFKLGAIDATNVAKLADGGSSSNAVAYKVSNGTDTFIVCINAKDASVTLNTTIDLSSAVCIADKSSAGTTTIAPPVGVSKSGSSVTLQARTGAIYKL